MKGRQVVLGRHWGAEAAALMVDGRVEDLALDASALTPLPPGAICRAVVDRLVKGQGGVFLRLPDGQREPADGRPPGRRQPGGGVVRRQRLRQRTRDRQRQAPGHRAGGGRRGP